MTADVLERPQARAAARRPTPTVPVAPADYVTIPWFCASTGYTEKAVRMKIERGVWVENREFVRAPDGHILISMKGYYRWAAPGQA